MPALLKVYLLKKTTLWSGVKNPPAKAGYIETRVQSLAQEDPLGKGMATHSSILAWGIPRIEEPGRLQSMRLERVRYD